MMAGSGRWDNITNEELQIREYERMGYKYVECVGCHDVAFWISPEFFNEHNHNHIPPQFICQDCHKQGVA